MKNKLLILLGGFSIIFLIGIFSCEHISNLIPANEAIQKNKHFELELSKIEPQIKTQVKNIVDSLEQLNILLTSCGLSLFDIEDARNKINAGCLRNRL